MAAADDDEWELVNDDGFVYKRKKRPRLDPAASSSSALALPDPATQEKNRGERRKTALQKIREKYHRELLQWEHLSNTLSAMQNNSPNPSPTQQPHKSSTLSAMQNNSPNPSPTQQPHKSSNSAEAVPLSETANSRQLVDELIFQAEQQEAILEDLSNLCDIAENLCSAREEEFNQTFTDLPVWSSSPQELLASLCVD